MWGILGKYNSKKLLMALVIGLSSRCSRKRGGMEGYSCSASNSYLVESTCMHPFLEFVGSTYEEVMIACKEIATHLFKGESDSYISGFPLI
jgi:hypothetical protein